MMSHQYSEKSYTPVPGSPSMITVSFGGPGSFELSLDATPTPFVPVGTKIQPRFSSPPTIFVMEDVTSTSAIQ